MTSSSELLPYLAIATEAARHGGEILMEYFGKLSHIKMKSATGDLVTEADVASEQAILRHLQKHLPDHGILAEESGQHLLGKNPTYLWAIDPLDGTLNYAHGLPFFCVSIGLLVEGIPRLGVVYAPHLRQLYTGMHTATQSEALCNGEALAVSQTQELQHSLLATGFPYRRSAIKDNNYTEFLYFADRTQDIRRPGSAALDLCFVAAGAYDGYWEQHLNPWDLVAGAAIVKGAGGTVSAYDNTRFDPYSGAIVASNGALHPALIHGLAEARQNLKD